VEGEKEGEEGRNLFVLYNKKTKKCE